MLIIHESHIAMEGEIIQHKRNFLNDSIANCSILENDVTPKHRTITDTL